jgi:hypothetical protein
VLGRICATAARSRTCSQAMNDERPTVRMECARTLVLLGDLNWSPT